MFQRKLTEVKNNLMTSGAMIHIQTTQVHKMSNILDSEQAAKKLNVSARFLQHDRVTKRRIPYVKIGRFVRYREEDLDKFLSDNIRGG